MKTHYVFARYCVQNSPDGRHVGMVPRFRNGCGTGDVLGFRARKGRVGVTCRKNGCRRKKR